MDTIQIEFWYSESGALIPQRSQWPNLKCSVTILFYVPPYGALTYYLKEVSFGIGPSRGPLSANNREPFCRRK